MIKENISWKGHDGNPANKTLYFNLTRFEIAHDMELEVLESRFKKFEEEVIRDNVQRQMTPPETREMLDIVQTLIKHSYGVRSADGKRFTKNEEVWTEFVEIGAFDAFIWYLFEDTDRANRFMEGIWPEELQIAADKVRNERPDIRPVENTFLPGDSSQESSDNDVPTVTPTAPALVERSKEWYDWSESELLEMDELAFNRVVDQAKGGGKNIPPMLLNVGQKRKNPGTAE